MTIERYNYNDEPSGRSETLVQALERCERLEKQLKIALAAFRMIRYSHNTIKDRKTGKVYYTWHYAEMKIKELEK
jgi:hypothetical protein